MVQKVFYCKVKFGCSEKDTKFEKNLPLYTVVSNFKWKIFSNFVFFSECPNFNIPNETDVEFFRRLCD